MLNTRRPHCCHRSLSLAAGATALAAVVMILGQFSSAQGPPTFTWDTIDAKYATSRGLAIQKATKEQVIYGRLGFASNRALMDDWYRKYLFPAIASENRLGEIRDRRMELEKDLRMVRSAAVHQFILDVAYEEATKRATGNYHPFVKYNAMVIVGRLNKTEMRQVGTDRYPPVRLAKAFDFMVDQLKKPDQLDVIRVGAMLGIQRHIGLVRQRSQDQPIPDAKIAEVAALAQAMVNEKTPPAPRTLDGHTWMRRSAVDVLATIGAVGDNQAVFASLVAIVGDKDEPLSLRCTAARAIQGLDFTGVTSIDPLVTSRSLGALAAFACRNVDARVKAELKKAAAAGKGAAGGGYPGMGGGSGFPGMGSGGTFPGAGGGEMGPDEGDGGDGGEYPGMGSGGSYPGAGNPTDSAKTTSGPNDAMNRVRKLLKLPLKCVLLGLRGEVVKPSYGASKKSEPPLGAIGQLAANDQQKSEIKKIIGAVEALVGASDAVDDGLEEMMKEVRVKTRELENLLPQEEKPAAKKSADDDALPGAALPGGGAAAKKKPAKSS